MSVSIEPIAALDIDGFHRTLDAVARERKYLSLLEAPPIEQVHAFVMSNIENGYPQLVAKDSGDVVGWCDVTPYPRPIYTHTGSLGMGLLPAYRGRGIGTSLLATTIDTAKRLGFERIELTVHADNSPAVALYEKAGFAHEGVKRAAARIDGRYVDVIMMALVDPAIVLRYNTGAQAG